MIKKFVFVVLFLLLLAKPSFAQNLPTEPKTDYFRAKVVQIISQDYMNTDQGKIFVQNLKVQIEDGAQKGQGVTISKEVEVQNKNAQTLKKGDEIVISKTTSLEGKISYNFNDFYRLNTIYLLLLIFFIAVVLIGGLKGIGSIAGMLVSLGVIIYYILPNILKGADPISVTIIGSIVIIFVSTYLAHGVSKKTTIALFSTLVSLAITAVFSIIAVNFAKIAGIGSEDFYSLQIGSTNIINIQGLFLSAIIISTLGALNDITTTQSATIEELSKANPKLIPEELFAKGMKVGREHIASLVNTLILAYIGSSFAVFIFFVLNPAHVPYFVILNSELVTDEVLRIIAGSIGLLLSVPIVTMVASIFYGKIKNQ